MTCALDCPRGQSMAYATVTGTFVLWQQAAHGTHLTWLSGLGERIFPQSHFASSAAPLTLMIFRLISRGRARISNP